MLQDQRNPLSEEELAVRAAAVARENGLHYQEQGAPEAAATDETEVAEDQMVLDSLVTITERAIRLTNP